MKPRHSLLKDSSGSMVVATVLMMTAFIGLAAIVVDLGHLFAVKSQLQNAADAGALAGARAFFLNNTGSTPDWTAGTTAATNAVKQNYSDNVALQNAVVTAGYWDLNWDPKTKHPLLPTTTPSPGANLVPAIQVTVDRK